MTRIIWAATKPISTDKPDLKILLSEDLARKKNMCTSTSLQWDYLSLCFTNMLMYCFSFTVAISEDVFEINLAVYLSCQRHWSHGRSVPLRRRHCQTGWPQRLQHSGHWPPQTAARGMEFGHRDETLYSDRHDLKTTPSESNIQCACCPKMSQE